MQMSLLIKLLALRKKIYDGILLLVQARWWLIRVLCTQIHALLDAYIYIHVQEYMYKYQIKTYTVAWKRDE